ncbi:MAG: translocation/assembly module TamB domain-containing protein [Planctomycetota bacterium]
MLYLTRTRTLFPAAAWTTERVVGGQLEAELRIDGVRGDGWRHLTVERIQLTARPEADVPLRELTVEGLALDLSLPALLGGSAAGLRSVSARRVAALVDATAPVDADGGAELDPSTLPAVDCPDARVELLLGDGRTLRLAGAALRIQPGDEPAVELDVGDVHLDPGADLRPWTGSLTARGALLPGAVRVDEGSFEGPDGVVKLRDAAIPVGGERGGPLDGYRGALELRLERPLARLGLSPAGAVRADDRLTLAATVEDGLVALEQGSLEAPGGAATLHAGELRWGADGPLWSALLDVRFPELAELGGALAGADWSGALEGSLRAEGDGRQATAKIDLASDQLQVAGSPLGTGRAEGELTVDLQRPEEVTGKLHLRSGPAHVANIPLDALEADVELLPDALRVTSLIAHQPGNVLTVTGLDLPRSLDPATVLAQARGAVELDVSDLPRARGRERRRRLGALPDHHLTLTAQLANRRADLTGGALTLAGGEIRIEVGSLELTEPDGDVELDLDATVALADLRAFGELFDARRWRGSLAGRLRAAGPLGAPEGTLALHGNEVVAAGIPVGELDVALAFTGPRVGIERLVATSGDDFLLAGGAADLAELRFEDASLELRVGSLRRYAGKGFDGALAGGLRLSGPADALTGDVDLRAEGLVLPWTDLREASLTSRFEGGAWDDVQLAAAGPLGSLAAGGNARTRRNGVWARIDELTYAREQGELALVEPFELDLSHDTARLGPLELTGPLGGLAGRFERTAAEWEAELEARELVVGAFAPELAAGVADGFVEARRTATGLAGGVRAQVAGWRLPGLDRSGSVAVEAELAAERLTLERLVVREEQGALLEASGAFPFAPFAPDATGPTPDGPVQLDLRAEALDLALLPELSGLPRSGWAEAELALEGSWDALRGRALLGVAGVRWRPEDEPVAGQLSALLEEGGADVMGTLAVADLARVEAGGRIEHGFDPRSLWSPGAGYADGSGAEVRASLLAGADHLAWVAERVPGLRRVDGTVAAQLELEGSLDAPAWRGVLQVRDGELKLESDVPALSALDADLAVRNEGVAIEALHGELGGAPFEMSGALELADTGPFLDFRFRGERLLIHRDRDVLLRADADVALTGSLDAPAVAGTLQVRRSWITQAVRFFDFGEGGPARRERGIPFFSLAEPPLANMRFDLAVRAQESIVLRNNVANGGLRPNLVVTGTGAVPRLRGEIYLDPTTVSLPGAAVRFDSGSLTFEAADPFVPRLRLLGRVEKYGYDVRVQVSGPYDAPEIELTSTPPLSSEDLVLLLFAGRAPGSEGGTEGAIAATQTVALYLAQDMAQSWLSDGSGPEDGEWEESLLDRVEVLIGREVSKNGVPTIEILLRLRDELLVENDRVLLVTEQDIFEDTNLGVRFAFRLR